MDGSSSSRPHRNLDSVAEHSYHDSIAVPPFVEDEAQGYVKNNYILMDFTFQGQKTPIFPLKLYEILNIIA